MDEVPIGAVVAVGGQIVAAAFNQPISTVDPTAHAEIRRPPGGGAGDRQLQADGRDALRDGGALRDVRRRHGARAHRHVDLRRTRAENRRRAFDAEPDR